MLLVRLFPETRNSENKHGCWRANENERTVELERRSRARERDRERERVREEQDSTKPFIRRGRSSRRRPVLPLPTRHQHSAVRRVAVTAACSRRHRRRVHERNETLAVPDQVRWTSRTRQRQRSRALGRTRTVCLEARGVEIAAPSAGNGRYVVHWPESLQCKTNGRTGPDYSQLYS